MSEVNLRRLTVPATPAGVRTAIDEFGRFSSEVQVPDSLRRRFQVALDEVLSNVARHGRPENGEIKVNFELNGDTVIVIVEDSGRPFNPLASPPADTSSPLEERKAGGVGIVIVTGLLEDVRYERAGERNRLTMMDRLSRITSQQ